MLTPREVEGLTTILQSLSLEKLLAVAKTTTKNMITFETSSEAMKAILTYTEKPSDLLRRQKITKQVIFNYLRNTGTVVPVNAEKTDYVLTCLKLWQSQDNIQAGDILDDREESCERSYSAVVQQPNASGIQECGTVCTILDHKTVEKLGMEFLVWFFNAVNKLSDFGSHHFWPDCRFFMVRRTSPDIIAEECIQSADCVAQAFYNFVAQDKLFFNPNITKETVRCEQERHGLIKIAVSGVVHQKNNCIGIFDIFFGLVQDPGFNNNWKIKVVRMESQVAASGYMLPNNVSTTANLLPMLA